MDFEITLTEETVEIDNGYQYLSVSLEDLPSLINKLQDKLTIKRNEENLQKNWNFLGGL